jgi:hypothetical protein
MAVIAAQSTAKMGLALTEKLYFLVYTGIYKYSYLKLPAC